jgi:hypothetical protein
MEGLDKAQAAYDSQIPEHEEAPEFDDCHLFAFRCDMASKTAEELQAHLFSEHDVYLDGLLLKTIHALFRTSVARPKDELAAVGDAFMDWCEELAKVEFQREIGRCNT